MKTALLALAALVPSLALADDPKPYVVENGHQVRSVAHAAPAARPAGSASTSAAAPAAPRASGSRVGVTSSRSFRHSSGGRKGIIGSAPTGTGGAGGTTTGPTSAPATASAPPWAAPGAKILTAGQQPVYETASGGGVHSVEGGGFINIDQTKANDAARGPGISWAPPDKAPSSGGSGTNGVVAVGSSGSSSPAGAPSVAAGNGKTSADHGATGFDGSF